MPAKAALVRPVPRVALLEPPPPPAYRLVAVESDRPMHVSFGFSLLVHTLVIFGLTIKAPQLPSLPDPATLEVVLVNSKTATAPVKADVAAQANLDGGGTTERDVRATSPFPVIKEQTPTRVVQLPEPVKPVEAKPVEPAPQQAKEPPPEPVEVAQRKVQDLEQQAKELLTQIQAEPKVAARTEEPKQEAAPADELPATGDLLRRSFQIARLEAQIDKDWSAYQKRPRSKFIGARAREVRFARYVEDWRLKVERVGNMNYPEAARRHKLYGSLQLTVAIRWDGTVQSVEINRSSGHKVLDAAARRIVDLAAPYAPFPDDIRSDTDLLHITRTWNFTSRDELVAE